MATTVADGLTKQLLGQSFDRFRADLGLVSKITNKEKVVTTSTTMTPGAAIKVLTVGSVLMQHAKAMSNATAMESEDLTTLWTTSIILMVMGAIYVLQLLAKGAKCCLRRLWASGSLANGESSETVATSLRQEAVSEGKRRCPVKSLLQKGEDEFSEMTWWTERRKVCGHDRACMEQQLRAWMCQQL